MSGREDWIADARRWLRFADEDLRVARLILKDQPARLAGFHAQQAAEKAIKSLLVLLNRPFPYTHDLERLQALLPASFVTGTVARLPELSQWAGHLRYPGDVTEPTEADAAKAVEFAEAVLARAHQDFANQTSRRTEMPEITAKLVNELRAKTGQPMMECKKMLEKTGGDLEAAIDEFRKKGIKASLAERAASEGRVVAMSSEDKKTAAIVEINCNTDFTARSTPFLELGARAARALLHNPDIDIAQAGEVNANATEVSQLTGENIRIGKSGVLAAPANGQAAAYTYVNTGKIGVIMSFTGTPSEELITDIGGHIAFARPVALNRDGMPAELVAKEREIAVEQAKATGKPQQIAEKIAEGKLNAFFKEQTLLDQDFFNAQKFKGSISDYLKKGGVTLEKYIRVEVGQS